MSDIIDILKNAPEYIGGNGRTDTEIETAEKQLGIKFSPDYRCYLKDIGLACFDGHELTGICKSARLNVVDVTLLQRQRVSDAYSWYVVEETGIDGIVIWQAPTGDIFQTALGAKTRKISDSLAKYIIGNY